MSEHYNNSLPLLLNDAYPEKTNKWVPWFSFNVKQYFDSSDNRLQFIKWASKELNIKEMEDWYRVKNTVIVNHIDCTNIYEGYYRNRWTAYY